jgi:hypothetical protein
VVVARRLAALSGVALMLALLVSPAVPAATKTTEPGKTILVYFIFTDKKLLLGIYREGPNGVNDLYVGTPPERGDYATFYVLNRGHKTHSLTFMKKKFTVKPGQKDHFHRALLVRGSFRYSSPSNPGKAFRGALVVT